jgi:dTDP-glucose pyrophosphorylase
MMTILLPMAGGSDHFDAKLYPYPIPLVELGGVPMVERVVANLRSIGGDFRFVFVVRADDCKRFHLDSTLMLIAPGSRVIQLKGETKGALCSALLAIADLDQDQSLIIANSDQIFEGSLPGAVRELVESDADAGCLCFDSVHPRWSYVRIVDGRVVEAAEKKPISRHAIAGFYYFRSGARFVRGAMRSILNDVSIDGRYYVAPVFNEIILEGGTVKAVAIPNETYHSLYTPQRVDEYAARVLAPADNAKREVGKDGRIPGSPRA